MKLAIPLDETKTEVCVSFGRAPYFLFRDTETGTTEIQTNTAAEAQGGAGLKAAQIVADAGTTDLITVRCGENAAEVLRAAEVQIWKSSGPNAEDNIKALLENKLEKLTHFHAGFHGIQ